ncbi:hypothetical protein, variant 1 [Aphanomyces invadans]|uniref:Uncharacterized protein n=2 Tax=Aphanomyces invadans TaxID=157072 RepID=A0A024UN56_9STRA|nr:hypothetical protein, variant 1 [Aphanomyces invadans]ETW07866.1 hypothetical protein, variant 1 [Aphanomyces invadans]|eukprot:XP_008863959.1 hypothetical protein, variant 1 [Aphanomyces invadans]
MEQLEQPGGFNVVSAPDKKTREHQAMELYQKGVEIAHGSTSTDDNLRAIEFFSMAISIRPNHARYFLARGNSLRAINEHESAIHDFDMAIELDSSCASYYATRGLCHRKLGKAADALIDFTLAIELDAKKGNHYFNRALVLYDAGYYADAIVDFTKSLEDASGSATGAGRTEFRALHSRSNCHRRMGNFQMCVDDMLQAIKLEPRNPVGYNALAQCYMEFGDVDSAIKHFTAAINLQDTVPAYLNNRGQALFRQGHESFRAALIDFNAAVKLDGKDAQAYYNRGLARLAIAFVDIEKRDQIEWTQEAKDVMVDVEDSDDESNSNPATRTATPLTRTPSVTIKPAPVATLHPSKDGNDPNLHDNAENAGNSTASTGIMSVDEQLEAAIADFDMACSLDPESTRYLYGKAMVVHLTTRDNEAEGASDTLAVLQLALDVDSHHVASRFHRGLLFHVQKQYDKAVDEFTTVITEIPTEPRFLEARGLVFQEIHLHDLAVEDFTSAMAVHPSPPPAHYLYHRGESYLRLHNFQQAVDDFTTAIDIGGETPAVLNARGLAHKALGLYEAAIADFSNCIRLNKRMAVFRLHRAQCYLDTHLFEEAHGDLKLAIRLAPTDPRLLYFDGVALFQLKAYRDSLAKFTTALKWTPPEACLSDLYYHMGLGHASVGEHIQGVEFFTRAIDQTTSRQLKTKYLHERAKALQLEGYYEEAIADFTQVILHNPTNAHAHFRRAFAFKSVGRVAEAAADIETAKLLDPTNPHLMVNYKNLHDTECIVLCVPGHEVEY